MVGDLSPPINGCEGFYHEKPWQAMLPSCKVSETFPVENKLANTENSYICKF